MAITHNILLLVSAGLCAGYNVPAASTKARLQSLFSGSSDAVLACPVAKTPLRPESSSFGVETRRWLLSEEGVRYPINRLYCDLLESSASSGGMLTPEDLAKELADAWSTRTQTGLFRSPFTAFLYERGWRRQFANAGFPGIDAEFDEAIAFFEPAYDGVAVDMSCGSGLMTRRLLRSGRFSRLLALDYSEAMLTETRRRILAEDVPSDSLTLCRADVAALPLATGSVDALHAGAALHCWPRLEAGLEEIARVLKPEGRFFATTFLKGAYGGPRDVGQSGGGSGFRFFEDEAELRDLMIAAGFPADGVDVRKEGRGCAIIKASMHSSQAAE